jgi:hypothetical protein
LQHSLEWFSGSEKSRFLHVLHAEHLRSFAAYASRQLYVFRHYRHSLGVYGTKIGVFEEADQVRFRSLLQRHDSGALEAKVCLEVLRYLTNQSLEGQLAD